MKIVKNVLSILFGIMFLNAGLDKFFHYNPMPENMPADLIKAGEAMMAIVWLMPLVAVIEIVGGILFAIPKTRALGAIVIFPVMIGIFLHNAVFFTTTGLSVATVLLLINIWIIADNSQKYKAMIA
ncbi:MAG: DoxX family membrane protein [Pedobacter sp.]|nr:MAG: DoxX family membrane protein [Pedobacter sp.]